MRYILVLLFVFSVQAFAYVNCDCEVNVHQPTTGTHKLKPTTIKRYTLERFDTASRRAQRMCRKSCYEEFRTDMSSDRLKALLVTLSQELIQEKVLGFNCTGLTTLKYPVRVKAKLGDMSLGNVEDIMQVVDHEEICFF